MSEQESKPYHHEISLDEDDGPIDWAAALRELEKSAPKANPEDYTPIPTVKSTAPAPESRPASSGITRPTSDGRSRYEELTKKRAVSISEEDLKTLDELADILSSVNIASSLLDGFVSHHPEAVQPRLIEGWRHNLKETAQIMLREFHQLRNGKENKTYDPRNVCTVCHTVYLSPLPDGVCDECRANRGEKKDGAY
jgi:hypothetical protein